MAMSFSRPDPSSPAQVADANFSTQRRGFDQSEVRDFLRMVSAELARLHERERFLERELSTAQTNPDLESAQFDDETLTRMLGEETARVLNAARASSAEIREKAEQSTARMLTEASNDATRLREEAEIEASRRRADATSDAEAELAMAKQQGREMVDEARAYRERVLGELARRRELAREQIEQLIHGRDRLTQAFERARLVAVDVVAEMQPLGEPDEYVNLNPSTGPVPVMVARDAMRPEPTAPVEEFDAADAEPDPIVAGGDLQILEAADDVEAVEVVTPDHGPVDAEVVDSDSADVEPDDAEVSDAEAADVVVAEPETDSAEAPGSDDDDDPVEEIEAAAPDVEDDDDVVVEIEAAASDVEDDDVVVDLFARLRADSVPGDSDGTSDPAVIDDQNTDDGVTQVLLADADTVEATPDPDADVEEPVTPFEQRDTELAPFVAASARKLKRALADEQNDVLDALRRIDQVRTLDALLPWASEHSERYTSTVLDELLLAARSGAASVAAGRTPRLRAAAGREAVEHARVSLVATLIDPLRDRLTRCIDEGDGDNSVITKKVRAVYREWKTQRIDEVLDDVFRTSHGRGLLAAVDPDGPVLWVADPSDSTCSECNDNQLAGAVAAGQEFPTGHVCTPAHPGCRCLLVAATR